MSGWIPFLSWILKLSTWKAFILWMFKKPQGEKEENVNQEIASPSSSEPNKMNVATNAGPSLQNVDVNMRSFLSACSTQKRLSLRCNNDGFRWCDDDWQGSFDLYVGLQHGAYVQVTSAIASSRTLTEVHLDLQWDVKEAKGVALVEEFWTAIASNHKIESASIFAWNVPLDPILAKFSEVLLESPLMTSLELEANNDHGVVSTTTVEKFAFALQKHGPLQRLAIRGRHAKIGLPFLGFRVVKVPTTSWIIWSCFVRE